MKAQSRRALWAPRFRVDRFEQRPTYRDSNHYLAGELANRGLAQIGGGVFGALVFPHRGFGTGACSRGFEPRDQRGVTNYTNHSSWWVSGLITE